MRLMAVLILGASACAFEPEGAVRWEPPTEYLSIWDSAQACTGRTGDFSRINWYLVPGDGFSCRDGHRCGGHWVAPYDVYISEHYAAVPIVPKHEMVHVLLGKPGHPEVPFRTPCNALVAGR